MDRLKDRFTKDAAAKTSKSGTINPPRRDPSEGAKAVSARFESEGFPNG
jgi:hypothetical protein